MRGIRIIIAGFLGAYLCMLMPAAADDDTVRSAKEDRVKVAFLYNFIKFVEWPGAKALSQTHEADICMVGGNPFGDAINMLRHASTPQLALNVVPDIPENQLTQCHMLFIGRQDADRAPSLLATARAHSILTVSELPGFADDGGIIEMVKTEKTIGLFSKDKINLRVNVRQAEAEGLRIDPQLLEIASEVIK